MTRNENGFNANTKAMIYNYKIEIFAMPKSGQWAEFSQNFDSGKAVAVEKFNDN